VAFIGGYLWKFLNNTMKKEGLAEEDAIVCSNTKRSQDRFGFFSMANEEMAEKLVCLTGIQMHAQYVLLSRHRACTKQPRYANWTEYKQNKEEVDPKVTLYLKEEPSTTSYAHRFVTFLNQKMNHFELCRGNAVVGCYRVHPGLENTTWVMQLASKEDVADKLLYLNHIIWGGSILSLRRHEHYQGASPKFSNFQEFVAKRHHQVRKVSCCYPAVVGEENCNPSLPNQVSPADKLVEAEAASAAKTTRIEKAAAAGADEKTRLSKEVCSKVCKKLVEAKRAAKTATSEKEAAKAKSTRLSKELSLMLVAAEKAGTASTTAEGEAKAETLRVLKQLATTQLNFNWTLFTKAGRNRLSSS
jgi:hypothetical protein